MRPVGKSALSPVTAAPVANRRPTRRSSAAGLDGLRGSRSLGKGASEAADVVADGFNSAKDVGGDVVGALNPFG